MNYFFFHAPSTRPVNWLCNGVGLDKLKGEKMPEQIKMNWFELIDFKASSSNQTSPNTNGLIWTSHRVAQ